MSQLFKIYFLGILITLLVSCENHTEFIENNITGIIENYDPTSFDSIICMNFQLDSNYLMRTKYQRISKCDISKNGTFNAVLTEPLYTYPILERIDKQAVISDTTAVIGNLILEAYKNGKAVGYIIKCSEEYASYPLGSNNATNLYVNKDLTINGTIYIGLNWSTTYHLNLKKGWNEVVYTYKVTTLATTTNSLEITNTTTENLKWRFVKYN